MEFEELFEFGPKEHVYLAEVGVEGGAVFFGECFAVAVVDCEYE